MELLSSGRNDEKSPARCTSRDFVMEKNWRSGHQTIFLGDEKGFERWHFSTKFGEPWNWVDDSILDDLFVQNVEKHWIWVDDSRYHIRNELFVGESSKNSSIKYGYYLGFASLMLGTSSKNIFPHGGKKWWFTMVESLRNHQLNTSKLDYNPCRTGK